MEVTGENVEEVLEIGEAIGRGSFGPPARPKCRSALNRGTVHLGKLKPNGREVAVKISKRSKVRVHSNHIESARNIQK